MHVAAFIGELQHYKNFKPSYLSIGKWAISPFLSDQVTYLTNANISIVGLNLQQVITPTH